MVDPPSPPLLLAREWLAAGLANALTSGLLQPFDVAKTRMQLGSSSSTLRGTLAVMWGQGGLRGLYWPGLTASMLREMLSSGPRAGFYSPMRGYYARMLGSSSEDPRPKILAALTTGTLGALLANPLDIVKVRLMRNPNAYTSTLGALPAIARAEGLGGLYRGLLPSTLRGAAIAVGELATYDMAKTSLGRVVGVEDGPALHVAASLVTGVVASVVAAPFDVIKSRAMASDTRVVTIRSAVADMMREPGGGPLVLFRGVLPAYLRLGPHALICFPVFEQMRRLFGLEYL